MRPPSRWLAPGAGTAMPPPPRPSGGGARRPEAPPHSPPPLPLRPKSGRMQTEVTAAPHPPRRGRCSRGAGHHGRGRRPHTLSAAGQRRTGGAQDGANGAALSEAGPGKTGARARAGGLPPPRPPPPRRTGPSAADRTAPDARGRPATPTARVYPGGARRDSGGRDAAGPAHRAPQRPQPPAPAGSRRQGEPTPACRSKARTKLVPH